jgi:hypothetical protein
VTKSDIRNPKSETQNPRGLAPAADLRSHPAVRNYTLFCLSSLFLLVVCLADRRLGWWCLLPALLGSAALIAQWNHGPPLVLASLAGLLLMTGRYYRGYPYWPREEAPAMLDFLMCAALLVYAVGHYRLLSLVHHIFPTGPHRPRRVERDSWIVTLQNTIHDPQARLQKQAEVVTRRSPERVSSREMAFLVLASLAWTGLAVIAWSWLMEQAPKLDIPKAFWRALLVGWAVLTVLGLVAALTGYVRHSTATPEESMLYLQDQLWRGTRREQGNLNRWLTWARLRAQRKKETS